MSVLGAANGLTVIFTVDYSIDYFLNQSISCLIDNVLKNSEKYVSQCLLKPQISCFIIIEFKWM